MSNLSRGWRSAITLPNTTAADPSAPRIASKPIAGSAGRTKNHSRTTKKNEPLTTRPESTALAGAGALACAGGSQRCSGKSAVLARSPAVISAAAVVTAGIGRIRSARRAMSSVPNAPYRSAAPSR